MRRLDPADGTASDLGIGMPPSDGVRQLGGSDRGAHLDQQLVAAAQQPVDVLVRAAAAVDAQDCSCSASIVEMQCLFGLFNQVGKATCELALAVVKLVDDDLVVRRR